MQEMNQTDRMDGSAGISVRRADAGGNWNWVKTEIWS